MSDSVRLYQSDDAPQLLSENGGIMLRDFNPKALLRFQGRKCVTCGGEIMDHWLRAPSQDYFCTRDGYQISEGITDCVYDVPEGFGIVPVQVQSTEYEQPKQLSADKKWDE